MNHRIKPTLEHEHPVLKLHGPKVTSGLGRRLEFAKGLSKRPPITPIVRCWVPTALCCAVGRNVETMSMRCHG
jgi:hypothetical protein